jgi:SAM-dependent methyltransferase
MCATRAFTATAAAACGARMKNQFKGVPAHSAEYFGATRDVWWNDDYLEMMAHEWEIERVRTVLDVGSGIGHWGRTLASVMTAETHLIGIDPEPRWVEEATRRAAGAGLSGRFTYRVGSAESLPFHDEAFDLVTCQTLLMHVRDPARVLGEMVRVTRRSGLVIVAEPTNVAGLLVDSIALGDAPETTAALVEFQLVCERGKKALGEGNGLIGESLPKLLVESGPSRSGAASRTAFARAHSRARGQDCFISLGAGGSSGGRRVNNRGRCGSMFR